MKRVLSAVLALTMVLSVMCCLTVQVSAATEGWVVATRFDAVSGYNTSDQNSSYTNAEEVTIDGNKVLKLSMKSNVTMDEILAFTDVDSELLRRLGPCIRLPYVTNELNEYPAGKTVNVLMDAKVYDGESFVTPTYNWVWVHYVGAYVYGFEPVGVNDAGWNRVALGERTLTTDKTPLLSSANKYVRYGNFVTKYTDLLLSEGLYYGTGAAKAAIGGTNKTGAFEITNENRCASWDSSVANGTYYVTDDCSALACKCAEGAKASCPRYIKMDAFMTKLRNAYILLDNFDVEVKASLYENTITGADAVVTTNPVTGESATVANGGAVTVNNYYGFTAEVAGRAVATYNGADVDFVYDDVANKTTFTVPAASVVTENAVLSIRKVAEEGWVTYYIDKNVSGITSDGGNDQYLTGADGTTYLMAAVNSTKVAGLLTCDDYDADVPQMKFGIPTVYTLLPEGKTGRMVYDATAYMNGEVRGAGLYYVNMKLLGTSIATTSFSGGSGDFEATVVDGKYRYSTPSYVAGTGGAYSINKRNDDKAYLTLSEPGILCYDMMISEGLYSGPKMTSKWGYHGTGGHVQSITEENSCSAWTTSRIGTYDVYSVDCSSLACECGGDPNCKRYAKTQEFLRIANTAYIEFDNLSFQMKANIFENKITLTGISSATAITNPVTGESATVANGGTVKVNDCHGLTVVVNGEVLRATYNNSAVNTSYDGTKTTITIPAGDIAVDAVLDIVSGKGDYTYTRERTDWFKGGVATYADNGNAASYKTAGGLATFSFYDAKNMTAGVGVIDEANGTFGWNNYQFRNNLDRVTLRWNVYEVSNRSYERVFYVTNDGTKDWAENFIEYTSGADVAANNIYNIIDDTIVEGAAAGPYAAAAGSSQYMRTTDPTYYERDGYFETLPVVPAGTTTKTAYAYPNMKIKLVAGSPNGVWYSVMPAFRLMADAADKPIIGTSVKFYGAGIKETATYHNITMNIDGGSYTALVDTMNFGTDEFTDNAYFGVEDYADVTINLKAPEGKVINTVSFADKDYTILAKGKKQASIKLDNVTESEIFEVTYTAEPSSVSLTSAIAQKNYSYKDKNGVTQTSDISMIIYGTVTGLPSAYGFKLSDGEKVAILPALGRYDGSFAIRVVGDIPSGDYTAAPYMINNGVEQVGNAVPVNFGSKFYVAKGGSDSNSGTESYPFATLNAAVTAAKRRGGGTIVVKSGEYRLGDTIEIGANDGKIAIYGDGDVTFTGGVKIPYSSFAKVTDSAVLNRIVETTGKNNVMVADLNALGVNVMSAMKPQGYMAEQDDVGYDPTTTFMSNGTPRGFGATLTYNDKNLTIAEYPNNDFVGISEAVKNRKDNDFSIKYILSDNRWQNWTQAKDMYALGYYYVSWCYTNAPATIDGSGVVSTHTSYANPTPENSRVRFRNLLEELDAPGEYYVDVENKKLYIIPPTGFKAGEYLTYSSHDKDVFKLNGAKEFTLCGIRFEGTTENCIDAKDATLITVDDCEFTNIGDVVIKITGCFGSTIKNSQFHDIGSEGIFVDRCGDRQNLVTAKTVIQNCSFERFSNYKRSYAPAIRTQYDVGSVIKHCEFKDAPHSAIIFISNNTTIQYNEFSNCCYETGDSGVVYTGAHYNTWGNKIQYNYFHDIAQSEGTSHRVQAVYLDDCHSQTEVFGNVFYNASAPGLYGGGSYNTFENNVIVNCSDTFHVDARGLDWVADNLDGSQPLPKPLANSNTVDWQTEKWTNTYPQIAGFLNNNPGMPKENVVCNNIMYNSKDLELDTRYFYTYVDRSLNTLNNFTAVGTDVFKNYGTDFSLTDAGLQTIKRSLPDFEDIPFGIIGTYDYTEPEIPADEEETAQTEE